jgi:hypothetical protein
VFDLLFAVQLLVVLAVVFFLILVMPLFLLLPSLLSPWPFYRFFRLRYGMFIGCVI